MKREAITPPPPEEIAEELKEEDNALLSTTNTKSKKRKFEKIKKMIKRDPDAGMNFSFIHFILFICGNKKKLKHYNFSKLRSLQV